MSKRRFRRVVAAPGELKAAFGLCEPGDRPDLVYAYGAGGASKADGYILSRSFEDVPLLEGKTLRKLLEEGGYDISTLKFSVKQKASSS